MNESLRLFSERIKSRLPPSTLYHGIVRKTTNNGKPIWVNIIDGNIQMLATKQADLQLGIMVIGGKVIDRNSHDATFRVAVKYRNYKDFDAIIGICTSLAKGCIITYKIIDGAEYFFDKQAAAHIEDNYAIFEFEANIL